MLVDKQMNIFATKARAVIESNRHSCRIGGGNTGTCEVGEVHICPASCVIIAWINGSAQGIRITAQGSYSVGYTIFFIVAKIERIVLYLIPTEQFRITGWGESENYGSMVSGANDGSDNHGGGSEHEKQGGDNPYSNKKNKSGEFFHGEKSKRWAYVRVR